MKIFLKHNIYFIVIALSMLCSCETVVKHDYLDYKPQIVVYSDVLATAKPEVYLTWSSSYNAYIEQQFFLQFVEGKTVTITDGENTDILIPATKKVIDNSITPADTQEVKYYKGNLPLQFGKTYTLNIPHEGKTVSASFEYPTDIAQIQQQVFVPKSGDTDSHILVNFQDLKGKSFYRIKTDMKIKKPVWNDSLQVFDTLTSTRTLTSGLIHDEDIRDTEMFHYAFGKGKFDDYQKGTSLQLTIWIETYTPALGAYLRALRRQSRTNDEPFVEPVVLPYNVTNGIGVFGGRRSSTKVKYNFVMP